MGTTQPKRGARRSGGAKDSDGGAAKTNRVSGATVAKRVRDDLAAITGLTSESVTSLQQNDDGSWTVTVEMLELERIPETDDVLGSYEVECSSDGELRGYHRLARYPRSYQFEHGGGGRG